MNDYEVAVFGGVCSRILSKKLLGGCGLPASAGRP